MDISTELDNEALKESYELPTDTDKEPHFITGLELEDLIRDLTLNKQQSELLASSLQQWNLLAGDARASAFRKRSWELQQHFSMDKGLCPDIKGLFDDLGLEYESTQWKLFIDAYLYSIKAVLLHIGNVLPSFPTGHSVTLKETSENLTFIVDTNGS